MTRRFIMLGLLAALSAFSTGCCGRIRQCIANRWHAHHPYAGAACCTPAYKVAAPGCTSCGGPEAAGPIIYQVPTGSAGVPNIGAPTPLLGSGSVIPGTMPPKN